MKIIFDNDKPIVTEEFMSKVKKIYAHKEIIAPDCWFVPEQLYFEEELYLYLPSIVFYFDLMEFGYFHNHKDTYYTWVYANFIRHDILWPHTYMDPEISPKDKIFWDRALHNSSMPRIQNSLIWLQPYPLSNVFTSEEINRIDIISNYDANNMRDWIKFSASGCHYHITYRSRSNMNFNHANNYTLFTSDSVETEDIEICTANKLSVDIQLNAFTLPQDYPVIEECIKHYCGLMSMIPEPTGNDIYKMPFRYMQIYKK